MPASKETLEGLVRQLPDLDKKGKVEGPPPEVGAKIFDALLAAGPAGVAAVVAMIGPADDGSDYKARYALRGMVMRAGAPGQDQRRAMVARALCAALAGDAPATTKNFLLGELHFAGGAESVPTLGALLGEAALFERAAEALLAIGGAAAAAAFRKALPAATGPRRSAIVRALGELKDTASLPALRAAVDTPETRVAAMWALANLADADSAGRLCKAVAETDGFDRVKALSACLLLAENCAAGGEAATARRIYQHLHATCTADHDKHVRAAAASALGR